MDSPKGLLVHKMQAADWANILRPSNRGTLVPVPILVLVRLTHKKSERVIQAVTLGASHPFIGRLIIFGHGVSRIATATPVGTHIHDEDDEHNQHHHPERHIEQHRDNGELGNPGECCHGLWRQTCRR